jgi:hypothetical protein
MSLSSGRAEWKGVGESRFQSHLLLVGKWKCMASVSTK